jgi:hypothetical protein
VYSPNMSDAIGPLKKRAVDIERAERRKLLSQVPSVRMPVFQAETKAILAEIRRQSSRNKSKLG